jgi:hypothetical protein
VTRGMAPTGVPNHSVEQGLMRWLHGALLVRQMAAGAARREGLSPRSPRRRAGQPSSSPPSPQRGRKSNEQRVHFALSPARSRCRSHSPPRSAPTTPSRGAPPSTPFRLAALAAGARALADDDDDDDDDESGMTLLLPTLDMIIPAVASGELLCDVAAYISGSPIPGVFRPPYTCATALSNIRRATQRLRDAATGGRSMPSQDNVGDEAGLLRGDRGAAVRWLLAARRCSQGPRTHSDGSPLPPVSVSDGVCVGDSRAGDECHSDEHVGEDLVAKFGDSAGASQSVGRPAEGEGEAFDGSGDVTVEALCQQRAEELAAEVFHGGSGVTAVPACKVGGRHASPARGVGSWPSAKARAALSAWLRAAGLDERSAHLEDVDGVILAWRDGLPLVRLVESLEGRRLNGIEWRPRAAAQCRRNAQKALEALRLKKGMPLTYLYAAPRVTRGDPGVILPLLSEMKVAYRPRHLRSP